MSDRVLLSGRDFEPGELVTCPSGRPAIVRAVTVSGEVTVELAPGGELAAFRQRWLKRPYPGQPCALVFLPAVGAEPANEAQPPQDDAEGEA